ncbi:Pyrimidine pathway regulatory protein 1 [Tolypocladium ophioglossoides CBS 100239]|uniref:Pyrimidine pathway regulatory protein 1 n=1 Tax=Tolypocladium ophioglossoides (strain CBS 100239) TaxID=1163406 RepID=A0A0L0NND1_TOLOC|nr:Pyrimidine pathway regulatory protein 1 [Tolypocladium ophioglossoides CBS 100239]
MPRSSFSRNPLLRVSRPVSACSRCRAAKVKCDGKLPACTACEKAGRENECSAANDQFARGKERSYVAALELRIEKLERRLQYARSRKASVAFHDTDASTMAHVDRRDSLASIRAAIHRKAARSRENHDVNSIVSDFGFLSVDATTRDFEPSTGNITFARLVLAATINDDIPKPTQPGLPARQTAHALVQYFMANIYSLFPCFSETALLTILDDAYQQDQRVIKDSGYWLLFMVLAVGSTAQSQSINDEHYVQGINFVSKALSHADRALAPGYVTQIQSLLLLTLYALLDPAHFDSWHLIGFTARAVVDLGLHQDPPVSSGSDKSALDMRRKIFYCTYALDRAISMAHARTFSFTDDAVNVAFPSTSSIGLKQSMPGGIAGPQSADPARLLFQLRRAQSFWYQELYQSNPTPLSNPSSFLWQMCLEMREWGESLPDTLPAGTRRMFEQELWYSYVYCIAPSARAPQITDYTRTLIFEYSLAYLNCMHDTAHGGLNNAFYTYQDALKVYFMANQFIAVLRDAEDLLLSGAQVRPPVSIPGSAPAPPIPRRQVRPGAPVDENVERSLWCLERIPNTLALYGARWDDATMLKQSFEQISGETIERLRKRQQMRNMQQHQGHYQNGASSVSPPAVVQMQGQQQQQMDMRWAGVDPSRLMQGGGR